jgi:predicted nucleic acid-binding protein
MALKAHYLDASALVKLVLREKGSDSLRAYLDGRASWYTTQLCIGEALNVLKRFWNRKKLDDNAYFGTSGLLLSFVNHNRVRIDETKIENTSTLIHCQDLAKKHRVDLVDALLIYSVKEGKFKLFVEESKTLLITADKTLAEAGRAEGLRIWNCESEPPPKDNPPT